MLASVVGAHVGTRKKFDGAPVLPGKGAGVVYPPERFSGRRVALVY